MTTVTQVYGERRSERILTVVQHLSKLLTRVKVTFLTQSGRSLLLRHRVYVLYTVNCLQRQHRELSKRCLTAVFLCLPVCK